MTQQAKNNKEKTSSTQLKRTECSALIHPPPPVPSPMDNTCLKSTKARIKSIPIWLNRMSRVHSFIRGISLRIRCYEVMFSKTMESWSLNNQLLKRIQIVPYPGSLLSSSRRPFRAAFPCLSVVIYLSWDVVRTRFSWRILTVVVAMLYVEKDLAQCVKVAFDKWDTPRER